MGVYKVVGKPRKKDGKRKITYYLEVWDEGRRIKQAVGPSKTEAKERLAELKADIQRGIYRDRRERKVTFKEFSKKYMKISKANKRSWKRDEISLKSLEEFFGNRWLFRIDAGQVEKYKAKRKNEVSPASVNRELSCLSAMFREAKKAKIVDENPVREVKKFQERKLDMHILSEEEGRRLIDAANKRLRPIMVIALNTGMRRGEIFNLRWKDIDFDGNCISIKESKSNTPREVPMNFEVIEALREIKRTNKEFIFYNARTKKPITTVWKAFKSACDKAKIKDLRFHDLRHTAATHMIMSGIDIVTVAEILGHSDIKMTMRYAHPTPENKRKATDALGTIFGKSGEKLPRNSHEKVNRYSATDLVSSN